MTVKLEAITSESWELPVKSGRHGSCMRPRWTLGDSVNDTIAWGGIV